MSKARELNRTAPNVPALPRDMRGRLSLHGIVAVRSGALRPARVHGFASGRGPIGESPPLAGEREAAGEQPLPSARPSYSTA